MKHHDSPKTSLESVKESKVTKRYTPATARAIATAVVALMWLIFAALLVTIGYIFPKSIPYIIFGTIGIFVVTKFWLQLLLVAIFGAISYYSWEWLFCSGQCVITGSPAALWLETPEHVAIVVTVYFLPSIISVFFKSKTFGIFLFNLLLGWTVVMWISLLFEAFRESEESKNRPVMIKKDEYAELLDEPDDYRQ